VLLSAGLIKATNLELFMVQIKAYGILSHPFLLLVSAWGMVTVQCCLGTALLVNYRPRISLPATILLWVVLLGGTAWAAWTGATDQCGCFGAFLEHSPALASVENTLFLAATIYARWSLGQAPSPAGRPLKAWAVGTACLAGILLPPLFGVPLTATMHPEAGIAVQPGLLEGLNIQGAEIPHAGGDPLLLVLLGTDCTHCLDALPEVDALAESEGVPPVIGLCPAEEPERKRFVQQFQPSFPLGRIDQSSFWKLLSTGDLPRVLLVRRGEVLGTWDASVPTVEEVQRRLTSNLSQGS
jgi:hypothetical protein